MTAILNGSLPKGAVGATGPTRLALFFFSLYTIFIAHRSQVDLLKYWVIVLGYRERARQDILSAFRGGNSEAEPLKKACLFIFYIGVVGCSCPWHWGVGRQEDIITSTHMACIRFEVVGNQVG